MPLTRVEPVAALVVIDLQKGLLALPSAHPLPEIAGRAARLARAFRARGLPVVLVNVAGRAPGRTEARLSLTPGPDWAELLPELDRQPGDFTVTKRTVGAFQDTGLEDILRNAGVTQIFLAGVATSMGVEATARQAFDRGYHVVLVLDAMTDLDPVAHAHSVERVFPRIGERTTTGEVLARLEAADPAA